MDIKELSEKFDQLSESNPAFEISLKFIAFMLLKHEVSSVVAIIKDDKPHVIAEINSPLDRANFVKEHGLGAYIIVTPNECFIYKFTEDDGKPIPHLNENLASMSDEDRLKFEREQLEFESENKGQNIIDKKDGFINFNLN